MRSRMTGQLATHVFADVFIARQLTTVWNQFRVEIFITSLLSLLELPAVAIVDWKVFRGGCVVVTAVRTGPFVQENG